MLINVTHTAFAIISTELSPGVLKYIRLLFFMPCNLSFQRHLRFLSHLRNVRLLCSLLLSDTLLPWSRMRTLMANVSSTANPFLGFFISRSSAVSSIRQIRSRRSSDLCFEVIIQAASRGDSSPRRSSPREKKSSFRSTGSPQSSPCRCINRSWSTHRSFTATLMKAH